MVSARLEKTTPKKAVDRINKLPYPLQSFFDIIGKYLVLNNRQKIFINY